MKIAKISPQKLLKVFISSLSNTLMKGMSNRLNNENEIAKEKIRIANQEKKRVKNASNKNENVQNVSSGNKTNKRKIETQETSQGHHKRKSLIFSGK